jgi:hypothetical protein
MSKTSSYLKWCIASPREDSTWWVKETSDPAHWDVDSLSVLDPKQIQHILDLMDPLREYNLQPELFELAFYPLTIQKELPDGSIHLEASQENITESEEPLFALPDLLDEDKSPYADFLNHITKLRIKLLNELIDFEQPLTLDEVEEALRERQNNDFMEGNNTHIFHEICDILEYIPYGYELDSEELEKKHKIVAELPAEEELPDLDEEELELDETMKWDEDEEEGKEDESQAPEGEEATIEDFQPASKKAKKQK